MLFKAYEKLSPERKYTILACGLGEFSKKSYSDASTDTITNACSISKGILFHYFGSKKNFYLFCLEKSLDRLVTKKTPVIGNDFYEIIFSSMDNKLHICKEFNTEMRFVNMASREMSKEVVEEKNRILSQYMQKVMTESTQIMGMAVKTLKLKNEKDEKITAALTLYTNAILNKYLLKYQERPDDFFKQSEIIKSELKEYIDIMLKGIENT